MRPRRSAAASSHAGIVNVLSHAKEVVDPVSLYAAMGGLHLSGKAHEPIIAKTDLAKVVVAFWMAQPIKTGDIQPSINRYE